MNSTNPGHPVRDTLVAACLIGALLSVKGMASGLVLVALAMVFWLPYSLVVIARNPERRRVQSLKVGIWILMLAAVLAVHFVRHVQVRSHADAIVLKIEQFRDARGRYPASLEEMGMSRTELKDRLGSVHYSNKPHFYYDNTFAAFHLWSYDFREHEWVDLYD